MISMTRQVSLTQRSASYIICTICIFYQPTREKTGFKISYFPQVVVLSMHQASVSDPTNVVFGFLFYLIDNAMYPVSLSVLKSSLVDLFLQQYNLTFTSSIFGSTSSFEILKFRGGITIIPEPAAMILQIPQILFNFTLNSSIFGVKENILELKEQLKMGLQLMPNEVICIYLVVPYILDGISCCFS